MNDYNQDFIKSKTAYKSSGNIGVTPSEIKQQLMKGSSNLLGAVHQPEPVSSLYQATFRGLNSRHPVKPIRFDLA